MDDPSDGGTADAFDRDVVVVGGGPAGTAAGVFLARGDLDVVAFDRGRSSIGQCAYLENYPGFPAGVDVETLYGLFHDHLERAGCDLVRSRVTSVDRHDDGAGFVVEPKDRDPVTARRVVAATRYDGEYLRGLDDDAAMFERYEHDGDEFRTFDREYPDDDGTTPVDGLYVASPSTAADAQAIVAAGRGARVARRLLADARLEDGWWDPVASVYDWARRAADDAAADRETWLDRFDERYGEAAPAPTDSDRYRRVREAFVDERVETYLPPEAVRRRTATGHAALATHLDADAVVSALDGETLLDAMDDAAIDAYRERDGASPSEAADD